MNFLFEKFVIHILFQATSFLLYSYKKYIFVQYSKRYKPDKYYMVEYVRISSRPPEKYYLMNDSNFGLLIFMTK